MLFKYCNFLNDDRNSDVFWALFFFSLGKLKSARTAKTQYRKLETHIPRKGIAQSQSQFPHSWVCEWFIYLGNERCHIYSLPGVHIWIHFEMEFLDISLSKDSSLLLHAIAIHSPSSGFTWKAFCWTEKPRAENHRKTRVRVYAQKSWLKMLF